MLKNVAVNGDYRERRQGKNKPEVTMNEMSNNGEIFQEFMKRELVIRVTSAAVKREGICGKESLQFDTFMVSTRRKRRKKGS